MNKRRFTYIILSVLVLIVILFSGCGVWSGDYIISGRVTTANPNEGISGVKINYEINHFKKRTYTYKTYNSYGKWEIGANHGDRVTISAENNDNYTFQPVSPYKFIVTESRKDLNFQAIGWYDDFSNICSGWNRETFSDYDQYYNKYYIEVTPDCSSVKTIAPITVPLSYSIEADMSQGSISGAYGFVFNKARVDDRFGDFYYIFRVTPDGYYDGVNKNYEILKAKVNETAPDGSEIDIEKIFSGYSPNIRNDFDTLKVRQVGKEVWVYLNSNEPLWSGEIEL